VNINKNMKNLIRSIWHLMLHGSYPQTMISQGDISLIVYDFDGVMTDNRVIVDQNGIESVRVTRADGLGARMIMKLNITQIILSTETNPVVDARAKKLSIDAITGVDNKAEKLMEYCAERKIPLENVMYVGNDLNDLDVMRISGYAISPSDAHPKIKKIAHFVTRARGGEGVVKEIAEALTALKKAE